MRAKMVIFGIVAVAALPLGTGHASNCNGPIYLASRAQVGPVSQDWPVGSINPTGHPVTSYRGLACDLNLSVPRVPDVLPGANALVVSVPGWQPESGSVRFGDMAQAIDFRFERVGLNDATPVWSSGWIPIDPTLTLGDEHVFATACRRLGNGRQECYTQTFTTIGSE